VWRPTPPDLLLQLGIYFLSRDTYEVRSAYGEARFYYEKHLDNCDGIRLGMTGGRLVVSMNVFLRLRSGNWVVSWSMVVTGRGWGVKLRFSSHSEDLNVASDESDWCRGLRSVFLAKEGAATSVSSAGSASSEMLLFKIMWVSPILLFGIILNRPPETLFYF